MNGVSLGREIAFQSKGHTPVPLKPEVMFGPVIAVVQSLLKSPLKSYFVTHLPVFSL